MNGLTWIMSRHLKGTETWTKTWFLFGDILIKKSKLIRLLLFSSFLCLDLYLRKFVITKDRFLAIIWVLLTLVWRAYAHHWLASLINVRCFRLILSLFFQRIQAASLLLFVFLTLYLVVTFVQGFTFFKVVYLWQTFKIYHMTLIRVKLLLKRKWSVSAILYLSSSQFRILFDGR